MAFRKFALFAAAGALAIAGAADASTTVTLDNITATWHNTIGGTSVNNLVNGTSWGPSTNGTDHAYLNWGTPHSDSANGNQSGYEFEVLVAQPYNAVVDVPGSTDFFNLAEFTHHNNIINSGTSITGTQLTITADVTVGDFTRAYNFTFDFTHDETPNESRAKDCKYGGTGSINNPPCADLVTINFNNLSDSFEVDGIAYTLDLAGFVDEDGNATHSFLSREERSNSALMQARITTVRELVPGVPEPATWALLISGFGLVGFAARRRSRQGMQLTIS